jgi:hypothetical protein
VKITCPHCRGTLTVDVEKCSDCHRPTGGLTPLRDGSRVCEACALGRIAGRRYGRTHVEPLLPAVAVDLAVGPPRPPQGRRLRGAAVDHGGVLGRFAQRGLGPVELKHPRRVPSAPPHGRSHDVVDLLRCPVRGSQGSSPTRFGFRMASWRFFFCQRAWHAQHRVPAVTGCRPFRHRPGMRAGVAPGACAADRLGARIEPKLNTVLFFGLRHRHRRRCLSGEPGLSADPQ